MSTQPGTALTIVQRTAVAFGLADIEQKLRELSELAERSKTITAITNSDGYEQAHAARMVLKNERIDLAKRSKSAREDAVAFQKGTIALEGRLVSVIEPEEKRLQKLQDAWDDEIEAEKQRKVNAELKRVADIQARIVAIRGMVTAAGSAGSALVQKSIDALEAIQVDESFAEFQESAADAKVATLAKLRELHQAAVEREAEHERIQTERAELAKLRAEQEQRAAEERARLAEEARRAQAVRAEQERKDQEARAAERAKEAADLAKRKAEQDRIEAEQKAIRDAEDARLAAERADLQAEQAKLIAQQQAADKAAEDARQAQIEAARPKVVAVPDSRPSLDEIFVVLAKHYGVSVETVEHWMSAYDWSRAA